MHAPRAHAPRARRLGAGLAAAAVVTAGLACNGTANAAELADFPQTLDFEPTGLVATADDAYAIGYVGVDADEDYNFETIDGYVEAVGSGSKVHLGDGTRPTAVSASPDGQTLHVIGTKTDEAFPDNGQSNLSWTVRTSDMTVTDEVSYGFSDLADVTTGTDGAYLSYVTDGVAEVWRTGTAPVVLGPGISPAHIGLLPAAEGTDIAVASYDWLDGGGSLATLRTIEGGVVSEPNVLGADGVPDQWVTGMDVDEANGLVYVVSGRDPVDGPQEYGLNVIGPDTDLYVPLEDPVFTVAVSPDGETVYLPGNSVAAYDADALDSYTEEDPAPSSYLGGSGSIEHVAVAPDGRLYVAQEHDVETDTGTATVDRVHALEAPGAPTGLQAVASEWSTDTLMVTWAAPTSLGGVGTDSMNYRITLQDQAGGEPIVEQTFLTDTQLTGIVPGHTYTLSVVATNGAFSSAPATTTYTAQEAVASPSAVAVAGRVAVGSRLSVATTGSWAAGSALSYEWRTETGAVISRASTVTLNGNHLNRRISVAVTGTLDGFAPSTVYSPLSTKVAYGTLVSRVPAITGLPKVGRVLTARPGAWTAGTRFSYRWTADGRVIRGATASRYKATRAVVGKRIRVVVTGTKPGYRAVPRTSGATAKVRR